MRIFTKSLLTLLLLCVAGGVSAAMKWQRMQWTPIVHEHLSSGYYEGEKEADANGVYKVYARSKEQCEAEGGTFNVWDSQFMITWGEGSALEEGQKIRLTLEVKADEDAKVSAQTHTKPGSYKDGGWNFTTGSSSLDVTSDWQTFEISEQEIGSGSNKIGVYTYVLNLGEATIENYYYFRNIKLEIFRDGAVVECLVSENGKWTELVNNGDCEGEDNGSFLLRQYPYAKGDLAQPTTIVDGAGVDGTRAVKFSSNDMVEHEWDTQYWIKLNEELPAGTKLWVKFDYRSENELATNSDGETIKIPTQSHTIRPGGIWTGDEDSYIHYALLGDIPFTPEWQTFENNNFIVSGDQSKADKQMGSIAFNMNQSNPANTYYFDNMSVQKYEALNEVKGLYDGIRVLFTNWTNMPDLVALNANGKRRLYAPTESVKVTIDGVEAQIESVEYDKEGALYVFFDEDFATEHPIEETSEVKFAFTNPTDKKYQLVYTNGDNKEKAVEDFEADVVYDGNLVAIPFNYSSPEVESCDPENGSFNLESDDLAFVTVTFDKPVKVKNESGKVLMQAKLDEKEALTIISDEENPASISLMRRPGAAALAEGAHTIDITNVYAAKDEMMIEDAPAHLTFSVGPKVMDEELAYSLNKAKEVIEDNEDERYSGQGIDDLKAAVAKYEAEGATYTAPSKVSAALDDLGEKMDIVKKHHTRCADYDENLAKAQQLVAEYGEGKFANHPLYADLATAVGKYDGKVLKDDEELDAAIADLKSNVKVGENMFTEGPSKNQDSGVKVLVERIRLGAETLKENFGVAEDDELIVAANNALTDDDDLAKALKNAVTTKLYEKLAAGNDAMFSETEDEDGNITKSGPDMTVFIKNPNMYAWKPSAGVSSENTPGWERPLGNMGCWSDDPGTNTWGDARNIDGLPEDCAFTAYHSATRAEQTITDLPAGNYVVTLYGSDWGNTLGEKDEETGEYKGVEPQGFVYAKTSDTPAVEEGAEEDRDVNFAATTTCYYAGQYSMSGAHQVPVTVTDGKLTIGLHFASDSQYFFSNVELTLVGPAEGVDYAAELQKFQTGVETVKIANAAVYYDLQGRRVAQPTKGLYIKNNKKVVIK